MLSQSCVQKGGGTVAGEGSSSPAKVKKGFLEKGTLEPGVGGR